MARNQSQRGPTALTRAAFSLQDANSSRVDLALPGRTDDSTDFHWRGHMGIAVRAILCADDHLPNNRIGLLGRTCLLERSAEVLECGRKHSGSRSSNYLRGTF